MVNSAKVTFKRHCNAGKGLFGKERFAYKYMKICNTRFKIDPKQLFFRQKD